MDICYRPKCGNAATPRPVYDANPNPAKRKIIGEIAVCDQCREHIDNLNSRVK